jgi:hypothetical protein
MAKSKKSTRKVSAKKKKASTKSKRQSARDSKRGSRRTSRRGSKRGPRMQSEARRMSFQVSEKSGEFFDRLRAHYRECRRKDVDIEARVEVYLADGTFFDKGTARVANVSASGALLTDVVLKGESFPTGPFHLHVTLRGGEYEGVSIKCKPVRFVPDRTGVGVRLDDIFVSVSGGGKK